MELITASNLNSAGLVLDILGIVLLFRFGLPKSFNNPRTVTFFHEPDDAARKREKYIDRMGTLAKSLLIFGFILQIISNHLPR